MNEEKIRQFLEDTAMYHSIRQVLEQQFDLNKLDVKQDTPNMQLGEITRACRNGAHLLEKGFKELEKFRRVEPSTKSPFNPAV